MSAAEMRAGRVSALLEIKQGAEQDIAKILREHLDEVGEPAWLTWVQAQWGWQRAAAYRHLNPELLDRKRASDRERQRQARNVSESDTRETILLPPEADGRRHAINSLYAALWQRPPVAQFWNGVDEDAREYVVSAATITQTWLRELLRHVKAVS